MRDHKKKVCGVFKRSMETHISKKRECPVKPIVLVDLPFVLGIFCILVGGVILSMLTQVPDQQIKIVRKISKTRVKNDTKNKIQEFQFSRQIWQNLCLTTSKEQFRLNTKTSRENAKSGTFEDRTQKDGKGRV